MLHAFVGEIARQLFNEPRAASGIGDMAQAAFFQQHVLRIARDAARERRRQAQRVGERQGGDLVGAADGGGEGRAW